MTTPRIIVTGATSGSLGFATAQALAHTGARVLVTARRDPAAAVRALSAAGGDVAGHPLDLADARSVAAFAEWYVATEGDRLDVLVNNAGIHLDLRGTWKQPQCADDGYEIQWRTNYLGTMHLTHLLLPLLARTGEGTGDARVVMVASKLHARGRNEFLFAPLDPYNSWDAYGLSKLALVHAAQEIARRYAPSNVRAYALHPGSVYTHIADRGLAGHRALSAARRVFAPIEKRMLLSPVEGAKTTVHCATTPDLPSGYYRKSTPAEPSPEAGDAGAGARLWDETLNWVERLS